MAASLAHAGEIPFKLTGERVLSGERVATAASVEERRHAVAGQAGGREAAAPVATGDAVFVRFVLSLAGAGAGAGAGASVAEVLAYANEDELGGNGFLTLAVTGPDGKVPRVIHPARFRETALGAPAGVQVTGERPHVMTVRLDQWFDVKRAGEYEVRASYKLLADVAGRSVRGRVDAEAVRLTVVKGASRVLSFEEAVGLLQVTPFDGGRGAEVRTALIRAMAKRGGEVLRVAQGLRDVGALRVAVAAMAAAPQELMVEAARGWLTHRDAEVRVQAARLLGLRQDRGAVEALRAQLAVEKAVEARVEMITSLGRIGDDRALPEMLAALESGDEREQVAAARYAGLLDNYRLAPALIRLLESDNWLARKYAYPSLQRSTGIVMHFDFDAPIVERKEQVAQIKTWWEANRANFEQPVRKGGFEIALTALAVAIGVMVIGHTLGFFKENAFLRGLASYRFSQQSRKRRD